MKNMTMKMKMPDLVLGVALGIGLLGLGAATALAGPKFELQEVEAPAGKEVHCADLNNLGQVVGYIYDEGDILASEAFVWEDGVMTILPSPDGFDSVVATSIDDRGGVLGWYRDWDANRFLMIRPIRWVKGELQMINPVFKDVWAMVDVSPDGKNFFSNQTPFDDQTPGWKNEFGWVDEADFTAKSGDSRIPILYRKGQTKILGAVMGGHSAYCMDMNNAGVAVGQAEVTGHRQTDGFRWDPKQGMVLIDKGGFRAVFPQAINNNGKVVGHAWQSAAGDINSDHRQRSFIWQDGRMEILKTPIEQYHSSAQDINDHGVVVGYYGKQQENWYVASGAWAYLNGESYDLNDVIPANLGWDLTRAMRVNNAGMMMVSEHTGPGFNDDRWAVLVPIK